MTRGVSGGEPEGVCEGVIRGERSREGVRSRGDTEGVHRGDGGVEMEVEEDTELER